MGLREFFAALLGGSAPASPSAPDMQRWQNILEMGRQARQQGRYDAALELFENVLVEMRRVQNRVAEATVLGHIGAVYTDLKRWADAQRILQEALSLARSQGEPMLLAAVLNDWATYLVEKGSEQEAQGAFTDALEYARRGTDPGLTAHILDSLADHYMQQQNASYARRLLEEANQLTRYQIPGYVGRLGEATIATGHEADGHRWVVQALRLAHAMGNAGEEVWWASSLARRYTETGKLHEAARLYQRVATLIAQGTSVRAEQQVTFLLSRADVCYQIARYDEAVKYAEQAIPLAEDLGRMSDVARAHGLLGAAYRALGRRDQAIGHLQTALGYLPGDAPASEAVSLQLELGRVQQESDPDGAMKTYQQAIAKARTADADGHLAQALTYLGRLQHGQRQTGEALESWKEAVRLLEEVGDYRRLAPLLCDVGNVLKEQGDRKQALNYFEQALVVLNNVDHPQTRGLVLSNVANVYTDTGDIETAQAFYDESIAIARDTGDRMAESLRLGNLGWFYMMTGRDGEAVRVLEAALEISRRMDAPLMQAVQRDNLAQVHARLGHYAAAQDFHREALRIVERIGDKNWLAVFHSNFGETLARQGLHEEASQHYQEALSLGRVDEDKVTVARTLWRLGDLQRQTGELAAAAASYDEAARIARPIFAQRDLAYAVLGQGLLALAEQQVERARDLLSEAQRLFTILHAPERTQAEQALRQVAA